MNRPLIALLAATALTGALVSAWSGTAQATAPPAAAAANPATTPAATHTGAAAIVAMGDSAISGEGAGTDTSDGYVAGTDGPSDYCHRSTKSEIFDTGLSGLTPFDIACSGAQTGDITSLPQYSAVTGSGGGDYGEAKQDTQLATIAGSNDVKMVVMTIGANDDFDFTGIMEACLNQYFPIPQSTGCRDTIGTAEIQRRAAAVQPKVIAAIQDVRQTMRNAGYADSDYQLLFQSYFTPITPDLRSGIDNYAGKVANGCPAFTEDLAWGHNLVVPLFSDALRHAAEQVPGVRYLDQRRVSYGHEVCAEMTTSPYEYTNGDVIDTSEMTRNGCDQKVLFGGLICMDEIRQSYHLRVAGYEGEGACLGDFYGSANPESYCTLDQQDGTTIRPLTPGQPWMDQVDDGGWFQLTSKATGKVWDFSGGGTDSDSTNGRPLITYSTTGGLNQSFVTEIKSDGSYEVDYSGNRDMCLDATGGTAAAGVKLEQWACTGNANQHWFFKPEGGGYYAVASAQNQNLVATIGGSTDGSGNPEIELQPYTGAADQLWQLNELGIVYLHG
ncbi:RICIN domain-containing protein [Catenulispora pinisilvae]|uniref:RICIN domain-containing protein n=1 Tax=Catenulispora pinisilvae TaxID=2705253 RepID=UPI002B26A109|nr:RICIN domain-containing protein [Catenulispora pinisilvae]